MTFETKVRKLLKQYFPKDTSDIILDYLFFRSFKILREEVIKKLPVKINLESERSKFGHYHNRTIERKGSLSENYDVSTYKRENIQNVYYIGSIEMDDTYSIAAIYSLKNPEIYIYYEHDDEFIDAGMHSEFHRRTLYRLYDNLIELAKSTVNEKYFYECQKLLQDEKKNKEELEGWFYN